MSYSLTDAEVRHRQYPETFVIPPIAERMSLRDGDQVKLIFNNEERMWVEVRRQDMAGYLGKLVNRPVRTTRTLKCGDEIYFEPRHVIEIKRRRPDA